MADIQIIGEVRGQTDPALWTGASSLRKRIDSGELSDDAVRAEIAYSETCFITIQTGARKRCVEDRTEAEFTDTPEYAALLGPQLQGGTPDEAVAYRLTHEPGATTTLADDIRLVMSKQASQYRPGAHRGSRQEAGKTDCGSVDNMDTKLDLIAAEPSASVVVAIVSALMALNTTERAPAADAFERLQDAVRVLRNNDSYFASKAQAQEIVEAENPNGVVDVIGEHKQIALIVNMVPGTTLHTSRFNQHNDATMTLHNLDLWNIFAEYAPDEQLALCAQAVATLMKITDGSLYLAVRTPESA